jgi:hypothetical protein
MLRMEAGRVSFLSCNFGSNREDLLFLLCWKYHHFKTNQIADMQAKYFDMLLFLFHIKKLLPTLQVLKKLQSRVSKLIYYSRKKWIGTKMK